MIDFLKLPSPCYVLDEELLDRNLATVDRVRRESGAEIIVALKACAMWSIFPELAKHSDGATASSAAEARLVFEEFGRPAHTYAPVYTDSNIDEILNCSDHITFNSLSQFRRFGQKALINGISCGLRINPQYSPVETDLYNPCVPGSRLGVTAEQLAAHGGLPAGVEGLHFHVLCESRPEHLQKALEAVETHFGAYLDRIKWLNMGGGHLMTASWYDCDRLIALLKGRWPAFNVFGEGIDKTQEAGQTELEDYIYLDIIPSGNQSAGRGYTDRTILVDAAIHTKGESNLEYLQISQELDDLLRPVFRFTDKGEARAVTIPDLAFNIVDKVLHATFTLAFRDSIEEPEAPPLMAELESNIRTNRKE